MPRLFRESPLNGLWEGSGNVICLDVLRALVRDPASWDAFRAEIADVDPAIDGVLVMLDDLLAEPVDIESQARRLVEHMALALTGSLVVRHGHPAVADAFVASRLNGDWGRAFGTLPPGLDLGVIIDRHQPKV